MEQRATAVIIDNDKILLIHRYKNGKDYWVLPGGGIKIGETPESALVREVKEELSLVVMRKKFLFTIQNNNRAEHHFLVQKYEGEPKLGGEELSRMNDNDKYTLTWLPLEDLKSLPNFFPAETLARLISTKQ